MLYLNNYLGSFEEKASRNPTDFFLFLSEFLQFRGITTQRMMGFRQVDQYLKMIVGKYIRDLYVTFHTSLTTNII